MLTPEQAKERLATFHSPSSGRGQKDRALGLPAHLREIAMDLIATSKSYYFDKKREAVIEKIDTLSSEDRDRIFRCLFPGLQGLTERTWVRTYDMPYGTGYEAVGFRVPGAIEATQGPRSAWLGATQEFMRGYESQDVQWLATWAAHLGSGQEGLGLLFASAIDAGGALGEEVFQILSDSLNGTHEIGAFGRHIVIAFLHCSRPDAWEKIEKLLLAAQRQEGLRQVVLESVHRANPKAFRRIVKLMLEHDMIRFSAALRAVGIWLGFYWDVSHARFARRCLETMSRLLEDNIEREKAVRFGDPTERYIGLWCIAMENALEAMKLCKTAITDKDPDHRFVTLVMLQQMGLLVSQQLALTCIDDENLRNAHFAVAYIPHEYAGDVPDIFPMVERLIARTPTKPTNIDVDFWPWMSVKVARKDAADKLKRCLLHRSPKVLIPYLSMMDTYTRANVLEEVIKPRPAEKEEKQTNKLQNLISSVRATLMGFSPDQPHAKGPSGMADPEIRELLLTMASDTSEYVRAKALKGLENVSLTESEAILMEGLLTRKASDLRKSIMAMLIRQRDLAAAMSAKRLAESKNELQRNAGLEIAQELVKAVRAVATCSALIKDHQQATNPEETRDSEAAPATNRTVYTLANGLGLYDPHAIKMPERPNNLRDGITITAGTASLFKSLDDFIHQHKDAEFEAESYYVEDKWKTLGGTTYGLKQPNSKFGIEEDLNNLQLRELWEQWWSSIRMDQYDPDGTSALRGASLDLRYWGDDERNRKSAPAEVISKLRYKAHIEVIALWLIKLYPPKDGADYCLDCFETAVASSPVSEKERSRVVHGKWDQVTRFFRSNLPHLWTPEHDVRLFKILRWIDQPKKDVERSFIPIQEVVAAAKAGGATHAEIYDQLLANNDDRKNRRNRYDYYVPRNRSLSQVSGRRPTEEMVDYPPLQEIVRKIRERLVELEMNRGELPLEISEITTQLKYTGNGDVLIRLMMVYAKSHLERQSGYGEPSRNQSISRLIKGTHPDESDTPEKFAEAMLAAKINPARLLDLAMFAPQWAKHVGAAINWPNLDEAVWWFHAHNKDGGWDQGEEIRERWEAEVSMRTPLEIESLKEGGVDVDWFQRSREGVPEERWLALSKTAKYSSTGPGHTRAQLFSNAMLGAVTADDLLKRIKEKRHGDSVRALGLLPLPAGDEEKEQEILRRYKALMEFKLESKAFGSMRQTSEKLAVQIAMDNLARTAGFPDPIRLQWAMERKEIGDLAGGVITVELGDLKVSLRIDSLGEAVIECWRGEKPLKSIPAAEKKNPMIKELEERKREVVKQTRRMRVSLEEAMVRGDEFASSELANLMEHPTLAVQLRALVFRGESVCGYPTSDGLRLRDHSGVESPIPDGSRLRIAHAVDLLATREWHLWQAECLVSQRVQPFKQVFRELYVPTEQELSDEKGSMRYAGHQVNPRQALTLIGKRGWVARPEEGTGKVFHKERIVAEVGFNEYFTTPADVEGLTVEVVFFHRKGEWDSIKIGEVPPRLFSEVMRDLDLMVSVAHQGGVDPEASASTTEMRASLVMETCRLLKQENVVCGGSHARIAGKLTNYTVHLGSGVVHTQPGGYLCIVPVHSQHRGRLFLPFVDNDPRTAEVVSKVLLLAKDSEIKDPIILEQIRR